jgi:Zn-dependent protease
MKLLITALLGLLKAGSLGKVLLSGGTMLLSIVTYAFLFGWRYAVGFVLLLFVHELGHYLAARQRGLEVGLPTFIPFVGAWIALKDMPHNAETEAYIGLGGPFLGTIGAILCYLYARAAGDQVWLAVSYAGFFLNLFNLIPVPPFDGGRITAVVSPKLWLLGVPLLVGLFFYRPSPLLLLMAVLAAPRIWQTLRPGPASPEDRAYYGSIPLGQRLAYAFVYLALAGFLAVMSHDVHEMISGVHPVGPAAE